MKWKYTQTGSHLVMTPKTYAKQMEERIKLLEKELDELKANHRKLEGIASSLRVGLAGYDPNHPALYR